MIYLYDVNEKRVGELSNDNPGACPYDGDTWKERLSDALINYEFQAPAAHPGAANILADGYIIRKAPNGNLMMLQIISLEEDHSGDELKKIVYTENSGLELLGNYVDPGDYTGKTVEEAAAIALDGTRWELGQADWLGQVDYKEDDFQTSLAIIHGIAASVKGEIQFRVEIQANGEILRFVDILQRRGRETGRRFEYGHDLKAIKRTVDRAPVATAIVPIGKGGEDADSLTIESIEWKVSNGDPADKPLGQNWIGDDDARMRWGNGGYHIKKKLETEIEDPAKLIQAAWDELQIKKEPSTMYEMDALTFWGATGSTAAEALQIGDGVGAFDQNFKPEITINARILELEYSFTEPEKSKVVTGNYKQLKTNINAQLRAIQSKLIRNEVIWTQGGAKITTGPEGPYLPEIDDFWLDTSNPALEVWKRWDGATWRESTPTEANQIAESVGRKWAAQSGADVTGDNTAADTEAVAGKAAETVKGEAEAGAAAKNKIDTEVGPGVIETTQGAANKAATAKGEAIEFTQTYAQKEITQGTARPADPEPGDMHIDTSAGPGKYKWERFNGEIWGPASIVSLADLDGLLASAQLGDDIIVSRHIAAQTLTSEMVVAAGLDAGVIKFGTMSGDRIEANTITTEQLNVDSLAAISGVFSSDLNGTVELDNGRILAHDGLTYASYGKSGMAFGAGNPYTAEGEFYAQFHADASGAKITVSNTQEVKLLKQDGSYADLYLDDIFGDKAYLFDLETDYMELVTGQITSATTDTLKFNGNPVGLTSLQPIWSGTLYLHETHTVTPSKALSECPNGWILVWSRYVNGAVSNSDWNTTYIPRRAPNYTANTAGNSVSPTISSGIWCPLPAAAANDVDQPPIAHKLIYVTDTTIKGHRRNGVGTQNGQVLRYVYPF